MPDSDDAGCVGNDNHIYVFCTPGKGEGSFFSIHN